MPDSAVETAFERLDRLRRSVSGLIDLVARMEAAGAGLRGMGETFDTTTPTGRLLFHLFGAIAELERGLIRERALAWLAAARERGSKAWRKPLLTGSRLAAVRTLWANPSNPVADICKQFKVSGRTLYRELGSRET